MEASNGREVIDIISPGPELLVSESESITLDQPLTSNPNVGGFGQGDSEIVLQDPLRPNGSVSGLQHLEAELTEKLEGVVLPEMSRVHEQCIYIIRERARQINPEAYTPQVVSIGPFHNPWGSAEENNVLKPMEELKLKYLKGFLNRTKLRVADILLKLAEWEDRIRSCYARPISYNSKDFLKMIMTDACFIIEYFLRSYRFTKEDPLMSKPSLVGDIRRDLVLLENQLPFFVLEDIYNLAYGRNAGFPSFLDITFCYFGQPNSQEINPEGVCPKHFTDLLRTFYLPSSFDLEDEKEEEEEEKEINNEVYLTPYSASQLLEAGLVFKASESKCLLDLKFDKGVLTMPCFRVDDITETNLRNILAFEEYHFPSSAIITQYVWFLDNLINTEKDVSILVDKNIIVNYMGDANSLATMVNGLNKNIWLASPNSKYLSLCNRLNGFYEKPCNKYKANLIHEYFNTPWKIASTVAAIVLLLFTLIQTIFSVCSYYKE